MTAFTRWIDPKIAKYRQASNPDSKASSPKSRTEESRPSEDTPTFAPESEIASSAASNLARQTVAETPTSRGDFLEIIRSLPFSIFSQSERQQIEAILALDNLSVSEFMRPAKDIVYVKKDEVLGPLTLDRLFRSGFSHFPVKDHKGNIIGCIHTAHLNNLDIKKTSTANEVLDQEVYYVRQDYTLRQALDVFLRTESFFLLVVDKYGKVVGILNFSDLCEFLFGKIKIDGFLNDNDRLAVAKRRFAIDLEEKNG